MTTVNEVDMILENLEVKLPSEVVLNIKHNHDKLVKSNGSLPTGYERLPIGAVVVKIDPALIPIFSINEINQQYADPAIPHEMNEEKGRVEENPFHPDYLAKVAEIANKKGTAVVENMIMFAVELLDSIPSSDRTRLKLLGKITDDSDEVTIEFYYKKFILFNNAANIQFLVAKAGVSQEAVEEVSARF